MAHGQGHFLVVDDNLINRKLLVRALESQGYSAESVADGRQALDLLATGSARRFDVILLDVVMPQLDGYQVLQRIKADPQLRDLPVIMISALDELDSVVRCIELGAEDYLTKPYNPALLRARISACLEKKRLRDQEFEYLSNVALVAAAAAAVETATYEADTLAPVAQRDDALGQLARVFQRMAREVHAREQHLRRQLEQLRLDVDERRRAAAETAAVYLPMDRRHALAYGRELPEYVQGAGLFADVSGFTPLTEALAGELGPQRGAEEITRQLNRIYGALIEEVHRMRGSVIAFNGDAITCWFDAGDAEAAPALRALACATAMQAAMQRMAAVQTPAGTTVQLAIKVAVAAGPARRFLVGDPAVQRLEVLAGDTLLRLAAIEQLARPGEVLAEAHVIEAAGLSSASLIWRRTRGNSLRVAAVTAEVNVAADPWPLLPPDLPAAEAARAWLAPAVYERLVAARSEFLAELRPAAVCFLGFHGIAYDDDPQAGVQLDRFTRRVQTVLGRYGGTLLQLSVGDKGSYLYAAFGAPVAHPDDAERAVSAALELIALPAELAGVTISGIGLAYGQMRAGAYGSSTHRTYGVLGDRTNLAARLMQAASGEVICDDLIAEAVRRSRHVEPLAPMKLKGKANPQALFRLYANVGRAHAVSRIDSLPPELQLTLKVASVIGTSFDAALLCAVHPVEQPAAQMAAQIAALVEHKLIVPQPGAPAGTYRFDDQSLHQTAYELLLFAQRRQLHRTIAEWYAREYAADLSGHYPLLAHHWLNAEDPVQASHYLELAGEHARQRGANDEAAQYFQQSLSIDSALRRQTRL